MEDFGSWWKDSETNFRVKKDGLTKEEAEHILPQILEKNEIYKSFLMLVTLPDNTTFYMYIWNGKSASLLEQNGKPVRINKKNEIPVSYYYLSCLE
ncbi:MAG: hypothetical protein PHY72_00835 [Candidatus Pacebacteria bacterium]|nr:hypothetical protein [Candidatus Paceibacterota bacterium]